MDARRREHLESQLSAYLDGELTPEEASQVETFLADDAGARALLDQLRATIDAVHALPRAQAPEALADDLRQRLERRALLGAARPERAGAQSARPLPGRRLAAAAVIALTFLAGYLMWSLTKDESLDDRTGPAYVMRETAAPAEKPASKSGVDKGREALLVDAGGAGGELGDTVTIQSAAQGPPPSESPAAAIAKGGPPAKGSTQAGQERLPAAPVGNGRAGQEAQSAEGLTIAEGQPTQPGGRGGSTLVEAGKRSGDGPDALGITFTPERAEHDLGAHVVAPPAAQPSKAVDSEAGAAPHGDWSDWTVIQLTYSDATHQRDAVETLRSRYAARDLDADHADRERCLFGIYYSLPSAAVAARQAKARQAAAPGAAGIVLTPDAQAGDLDQQVVNGEIAAPADQRTPPTTAVEGTDVSFLTLDLPDPATLDYVLANVRADTKASGCQVLARTPIEAAGQPAPTEALARLGGAPIDEARDRTMKADFHGQPRAGDGTQSKPHHYEESAASLRPAPEARGTTSTPAAVPPPLRWAKGGAPTAGRSAGPEASRPMTTTPQTRPAAEVSNVLRLYLRVSPATTRPLTPAPAATPSTRSPAR